jgi:hypothetical protein
MQVMVPIAFIMLRFCDGYTCEWLLPIRKYLVCALFIPQSVCGSKPPTQALRRVEILDQPYLV